MARAETLPSAGGVTIRIQGTTRASFRILGEVLLAGLGICSLLAALELWVRLARVPVFIVPAPSVSLSHLVQNLAPYLYELQFTLLAAFAGLMFGLAIGIVGAIVMAHWTMMEKALFPLAVILKLTPFVAIAPLLVIWLGYNIWPKIVIAALITFFPVLVNCMIGFRSADPLGVQFLRSVGASRAEIFWHLRWPASLPYLLAALRISVNLSLTGAIVGEILGTDRGIGRIIADALTHLNMPDMFAAIELLALVGVMLTVITGVIERRALFWHDSTRIVQ
jgi:NitT/TauT family transport system permease protein